MSWSTDCFQFENMLIVLVYAHSFPIMFSKALPLHLINPPPPHTPERVLKTALTVGLGPGYSVSTMLGCVMVIMIVETWQMKEAVQVCKHISALLSCIFSRGSTNTKFNITHVLHLMSLIYFMLNPQCVI